MARVLRPGHRWAQTYMQDARLLLDARRRLLHCLLAMEYLACCRHGLLELCGNVLRGWTSAPRSVRASCGGTLATLSNAPRASGMSRAGCSAHRTSADLHLFKRTCLLELGNHGIEFLRTCWRTAKCRPQRRYAERFPLASTPTPRSAQKWT